MFEQLGEVVDRRWRERKSDPSCFPEVARTALAELPPATSVTWDEIVAAAFFDLDVSQPEDASFGQPPLVVYRGPGFYIEVLSWLEGTTSIHDHAFAGAFHVLAGSSLHCTYDFRERRVLHEGLALGDLHFQHAELLHAGDVRTIIPGRDFIHALFHLDRPSISVVVRTNGDPTIVQSDYLKPSVRLRATAPEAEKGIAERRRALLHAKASTDRSSYVTLVERVVSEADVLTAYDALEDFCLRELSLNGALEHEVIDRARSRFGGEVVDELVACFVESRWTSDLIARRAEIQSADHRTFLALLLNLPERKPIYELAGKPTVDRWLRELTRATSNRDARLLDIQVERDEPLPGGVTMANLLHRMIDLMTLGATGDALVRELARTLDFDASDVKLTTDLEALEAFVRTSALRPLVAR